MKDITIIFREKLEIIPKLVNEDKFKNCQNIFRDLIKTSWTLDLKNELFISEVLEGVFNQIGGVVDEYEVPEESTKELGNTLKKQIDELIKSYMSGNTVGLYNSLREIRCVASHYQLPYQNYSEKESEEILRRRRLR